jgi:ribosomal protein S1
VIKIDPERRRIGLSRRKVDSAAYTDLDWKMALSDEIDQPLPEEDDEFTTETETAEE